MSIARNIFRSLAAATAVLVLFLEVFHEKNNARLQIRPPPEMLVPSAQREAEAEPYGEPMALSLDYWEQTGNALKNLFDLQCWAKSVGIDKVLQPSIWPHSTSVFSFVVSKSALTFQDLFDIGSWNQMSLEHNFSTLVTKQYFLEHATREVVYVQFHTCLPLTSVATRPWYKYLYSTGFHVSRTACIDFRGKLMREKIFQEKIFGHGRRNITVLFHIFRGVRGFKPQRVALMNSRCNNCFGKYVNANFSTFKPPNITYVPLDSSYPILPSKRLSDYLDRFLSEQLAGSEYIAVMLRTEKLYQPVLTRALETRNCLKRIQSDWKAARESHNLSKTLLFSDIGKYGSLGWSNGHAKEFSKHIQNLLHVEMSLDKVNAILEKMTGSRNSAQIAVLNRRLVARARCVVIVGGGAFQMQTAAMYSHYHRGMECYSFRDSSCDSVYITHVYGRGIHRHR